MFKSATFKLTMWYLAIAMAISLLFSIALYNVTTNELSRGLQNESKSLYNQFPVFQNDPEFGFHTAPYYESSAHRILIKLILFNVVVLCAAGLSSYLLARRTLEPIEAAHEQQKRFTSDVSHELRTPLTAIRMESEVALLDSKPSAKELKSIIKSNLEEVSKLETIINNLLRLSRLEADLLQQNFVPLESSDIITTAIEQVSKKANDHKISVEYKPKALPLSGDRDSLIQLMVTILDNAIKYSKNDSKIKVNTSSDNNKIYWEVIDNGIGIEPKALSQIFERFYRADSSRTKSGNEGYGLGLSIAKMIADIHSGQITISSQIDQGTTVTIELPKA